MTCALKKWEQTAPSGNSGNASGNTETPMGRAFRLLVPTVPTKKHISYTRARNIFARLFKLNFPLYICFSLQGVGTVGTKAANAVAMRVCVFPLLFPLFPLIPLAARGGAQ